MNAPIIFEKFTDGGFQENHIGHVIEDFVDHKIKFRRMQINASKNFHRFSLACYGDKWLASNP
jgi:hypothetical protein